MTRLILVSVAAFFITFTACQKEALPPLDTQNDSELLQKAAFTNNSGNPIAVSDLPYEVQKYLKITYPTAPMIGSYFNDDGYYFVLFKSDLILYFKANGVYMKAITMEGNSTNIPNEVLPDKALKYLKITYPENPIGHTFKTNNNQFQVFLSDGMFIYFDEYGTFMEDSNGGSGTGNDNDTDTEVEEEADIFVALNELPNNTQKYLKIYFSMYEFGKAFKNTKGYKAYMENELLLYFDPNGAYLSADLSNAPNAIISKIMDFEELPIAAIKFVKNNYPEATPYYTFKQSNEQYRVQLSNNLIIYFNMQGEVLEIVEI
ncbi:MAG: PepSY-like domain-containing protein [Chitinophagales bacterium]